ncbi:hypothetical protein DY000_02021715 [Brassica cretica]|uniref:Uncharacterized protein n=1 Tax=Brassica cretica TaxID=69181 RepID=A0ABQ7EBQ2_BRACR|nr:hypothetical protein DY000_02021715 [Brassica cretica]
MGSGYCYWILGISRSLRKLKISSERRLTPIFIKTGHEGYLSDYAFSIFVLFSQEIDQINQGSGLNEIGSLWYSWKLGSKCFNTHQSGFIGKAFEAPDSRWVKVAERGHRRPSNYQGYHKGEGEGSRYKSTRREDGRQGALEAGTGVQETHVRSVAGQQRVDHAQRTPHKEMREDGEIKNSGEEETLLPSLEFQLELAKTQAEGSEVIGEPTDEDKGLQMLRGMVEHQNDHVDDFDMEMDAINATLEESDVDMEDEGEFQTLSEEEADQAEHASRVQEEKSRTKGEEELVPGDDGLEKGMGAGELALRQGSRKRLFKTSLNTAGSNKMRMASALVSPRRKAAAKDGTRHGDGSKLPEIKGPSNPKPANLKF